MKQTNLIAILIAYILGLCSGVLGVVTFRHEIWPLTDHVGIMIFYLVGSIPIFASLILWYFFVSRMNEKVVGTKAAKLINRNLTFLLITIVLMNGLTMGLFFVAVK